MFCSNCHFWCETFFSIFKSSLVQLKITAGCFGMYSTGKNIKCVHSKIIGTIIMISWSVVIITD